MGMSKIYLRYYTVIKLDERVFDKIDPGCLLSIQISIKKT